MFRWEVSPWPIAHSLLWDSTRLRLLVEIGRQRSVSAAARAIGIGQPTASEHLRTLESAAGQRLVERDGRGSRLTEAGTVLALHAGQALQTLRAGEEELQRLAGLELGTIHIGASTTPGVYLLPDTLGCFKRDHPNVTVEVEIASTGDILERLLAGQVQLALVGDADTDERIQLEPFISDEIVGVARPGQLPLRNGQATAKDIALQTLLVREPRSSTRQISDRALTRAGIRPERTWELDSTEAISRAAREGLGVAFLSRFAVAEEIGRDELERFRIAGRPRLERNLHIARRPAGLDPERARLRRNALLVAARPAPHTQPPASGSLRGHARRPTIRATLRVAASRDPRADATGPCANRRRDLRRCPEASWSRYATELVSVASGLQRRSFPRGKGPSVWPALSRREGDPARGRDCRPARPTRA